MSEDNEKEHGFKWWLRYVIVPLIGSGGIIAIIAIVLPIIFGPPTKSPAPTSVLTSTSATAKSEKLIPIIQEQQKSVTIESISSGVQITGRVIGLTDVARRSHKIVVYIKTDKWYIHPYAIGGDGKSWASIAADGSWKIGTIRREFSASSIVALVVPSNSTAPPTVESPGSIPNLATVERRLEGTPDFDKL